MTLVKICGIRTAEEGRAALEAGADWLGFVFWPSKRAVSIDVGAELIQTLRSERRDWSAVGVFVDPEPEEVATINAACRLDYVQLSGNEDAALVRAMPVPTVKAIHVQRGQEAAAAETVRTNALGAERYLLDTHAEGMYGGTGASFDWPALRSIGPECFVAGGLRPDNVQAALRVLAPHGVDVSSGVELPDGSAKDLNRIRAFLEAVRSHDA